jgi:hypothetical protein
VTAVSHEGAVPVLLLEQPFRLLEDGLGHRGARDVAHDLHRTEQLDTMKIFEVVTAVNDRTKPWFALQVDPTLARHEGVQPQGGAIPHEPQRRVVRLTVAADTGHAARALLHEEGVDLAAGHSDGLPASLLFDDGTSRDCTRPRSAGGSVRDGLPDRVQQAGHFI